MSLGYIGEVLSFQSPVVCQYSIRPCTSVRTRNPESRVMGSVLKGVSSFAAPFKSAIVSLSVFLDFLLCLFCFFADDWFS